MYEDSILATVKDGLGTIPKEDTSFDNELVICINSIFGILQQLGVGPDEGFSIGSDYQETWEEFLGTDKRQNMVKSYVIEKTRSMFDPATSSIVAEAKSKIVDELEWRIRLNGDVGRNSK